MTVEQRQSQRKVLRIKALLSIDDAAPLAVRTMDVGKFGMGLVDIPLQLSIGQRIQVAFEMFFDGKNHDIEVNARVSYCIKAEGDGFKAGIQFLNLDAEGVLLIAQYIGS